MLLERYLTAADKISALAVGDPDIGTAARDVPRPPGRVAGQHIEGLPLGTVGGILAR